MEWNGKIVVVVVMMWRIDGSCIVKSEAIVAGHRSPI